MHKAKAKSTPDGRAKLAKALEREIAKAKQRNLEKKDRFVCANDFSRISPVIHPRTLKAGWPHRCESIREFPYANDFAQGSKDLQWFRCHMPAKFGVNGRRLCARHAGILALERMVEVPHTMMFWDDVGTLEELKQRLSRT